MKKKLLIATMTLTVISSVYAAQGKGYHEYGEELHSAPGFNFHIEEVVPGTTAAQKKTILSGRTTTSVPSRSGRINQYITVDGYHGFTISNNTHQRQTYEVNVSLDCDNLHSSYRRYVDIEPGGYYARDDHTYGAVQESHPGNYRIEAASNLRGESSDSSRDSNTLYVSK